MQRMQGSLMWNDWMQVRPEQSESRSIMGFEEILKSWKPDG
jgi:hypothetical protein